VTQEEAQNCGVGTYNGKKKTKYQSYGIDKNAGKMLRRN
jgi:hypothetical protein